MKDNFQYDVFISHSSKDKPVVRDLAERLKEDGLRVWLDELVIQPGDMIGLKVEQGLEQSRTLILVMSKNAFESDWVSLERHTLLFRDPTNSQRRFIPLLIEDCKIPDVIAQFAWLDWRQKSDETYEKLLSACRSEEEVPIEVSEPKEPASQTVMVLKGHSGSTIGVAIMPDGKKIVSSSGDNTLKVWNLDSGQCLATFKGHTSTVYGVAVTPDGKRVVSGSVDKTIRVWDLESGRCISTFEGHSGEVWGIAITPDGKKAVSGSNDYTLKVWDLDSGQCLVTFEGHTSSIREWAVAVTPDGKKVVSGSSDKTLKVWDLETGQCLATFEGHADHVRGVAVTPDGKKVVSSSDDKTLKVWDLDSGQCLATFEGHTNTVLGVAVTPDGKKVVSGSLDHTLKVWDLESGQCLATFEGHTLYVYGVAVTPDGKRVVSASHDKTIRVWDLPEHLVGVEPATRYTNAKVALIGDSGVGKTGLAIRLAEDRWEVTDSTHGMNVWQLELPEVEEILPSPPLGKRGEMEREVWLWDFAGQPDYRLIHQLYMDETALALMVIDPQRDNPFEPLGHWEKALTAAVKHDPAKLLVAGRCDRGGITVSKDKLKRYCETHGYDDFLNTAAKTGDGCEALKDAIAKYIPWDRLPWTATSVLFKSLKDAIIRIKEEGIVLVRISELRQRLQLELYGRPTPDPSQEGKHSPTSPQGGNIEEKDLRAVVGLLAGQGIVQQLAFGDFVLLQPEQINNYASAVVRCVRENTDEIGCIAEREVLDADIDFKDMERLDEADEKILLRAMLQTFIDRSLCVREEPHLVFPSYFKQDRPEITEHPNVFVTYGFSGTLDEIYTTLVVRLHYTNDFEKDQLWNDAADFTSLSGKRVGLQMTKKSDDTAEIQVYFEADVPVDTQVSFIKYIHEHLQKRAKDVSRVRSYVCPHCDTPLENRKAIKKRLEIGKTDIICGMCEERVPLIDLIEEKFASDEFSRVVQKMDEQAQINLDNESRELILVGHAFSTAGEAGQIFRPTSIPEWGIDGEIEFKNDKGEPSGKRVYLQLKTQISYNYTRRDGKEIFTIKNPRQAEYWQSREYPVMLVTRTSEGQIHWMNVTEYLKRHGIRTQHVVFEGEPLTALNLSRMRDKLFK